jgi:hypothetical protein
VGQQVVQADRSRVVSKRLEREAVIPGCELELLARNADACGRFH